MVSERYAEQTCDLPVLPNGCGRQLEAARSADAAWRHDKVETVDALIKCFDCKSACGASLLLTVLGSVTWLSSGMKWFELELSFGRSMAATSLTFLVVMAKIVLCGMLIPPLLCGGVTCILHMVRRNYT